MSTSPHLHSFDVWLDAYVAGTSTPASRAASDSTDAGVRDAARQFHGLARRAEQASTGPSYITTWEDFMSTQAPCTVAELVSARSNHQDVGRVAVPSLRGIAPPANHGQHPAWNRAANALLAAVLILTIGVGVWRVTGGTGDSGNGNDPGGNQQAALAPDPSVWTPEPSDATPTSGPVSVELPEPSECTVEPLTVDEVMAIVDNPKSALGSLVLYTDLVRSTPEIANSEGPGHALINQPPSRERLDELIAVHREWIACSLADSWFQRWALSDPRIVYRDVTQILFPMHLTRDNARSLLVELEAKGQAGDLTLPSSDFTGDVWIPLIDPDPAHSNQVVEPQVQVGTLTFDSEGNRVVEWGDMMDQSDLDTSAAYMDQEPGRRYLSFIWSEIEGRWLIYDDLGMDFP